MDDAPSFQRVIHADNQRATQATGWYGPSCISIVVIDISDTHAAAMSYLVNVTVMIATANADHQRYPVDRCVPTWSHSGGSYVAPQ